MFHDPTSAVARAIIPDAPPERLEMMLRGREAAARLLWSRRTSSEAHRPPLAHRRADPGRVPRGSLIPLAYGEAYVAASWGAPRGPRPLRPLPVRAAGAPGRARPRLRTGQA